MKKMREKTTTSNTHITHKNKLMVDGKLNTEQCARHEKNAQSEK